MLQNELEKQCSLFLDLNDDLDDDQHREDETMMMMRIQNQITNAIPWQFTTKIKGNNARSLKF